MTQPWKAIVNRAVALGVIPCGEEHTVRFTVFHQAKCMTHDAAALQAAGDIDCDFDVSVVCDCKPWIVWREVCDPIEQFNIIIDKSNSKCGLI
jgi:hypothetical protein